MAQANTRPVVTSVQGTYKPRWRKRIGFALLILVLLIGGFFIVRHIKHDRAINKEHNQYLAAEADLNNLADQITLKVGKPADRQTNNYCGHTSVEFGTGDLYCNTEVYLLYGTSSLEHSMELAKSIEGSGLRNGQVKQEYDPTVPADSRPPSDLLSESFDSHGLECVVDYSHYLETNLPDLPTEPPLSFKGSVQGLLIEAGCSARHPKAAYYPSSK